MNYETLKTAMNLSLLGQDYNKIITKDERKDIPDNLVEFFILSRLGEKSLDSAERYQKQLLADKPIEYNQEQKYWKSLIRQKKSSIYIDKLGNIRKD
jgi:hypothetical protein